jgi:hypothetical protein
VDVGSGQAAEAAGGAGRRVPALRWRRAFPGDQAQLSALRRWLEQLLPPCPARDDVVSVAVELCTNAVCHTASGQGGQFAVEVTWSARIVRVAVFDGGAAGTPKVIEDPQREDGRGLVMVNALSVRQGFTGDAGGRVVWADVLWAGPGVPGQPGFGEGFVSAIGEAGAELGRRYPGCSSGSAAKPGSGGRCHCGAGRARWWLPRPRRSWRSCWTPWRRPAGHRPPLAATSRMHRSAVGRRGAWQPVADRASDQRYPVRGQGMLTTRARLARTAFR